MECPGLLGWFCIDRRLGELGLAVGGPGDALTRSPGRAWIASYASFLIARNLNLADLSTVSDEPSNQIGFYPSVTPEPDGPTDGSGVGLSLLPISEIGSSTQGKETEMSEKKLRTLPVLARPLYVEDPPEDETQTDDTTKSGTLPTPGAEEPLGETENS